MTISVDELARKIPDGSKITVPADYSGIAMEATRALIRRKAKDLHIIGAPTSGLQSELLIGAGCAATFESSALTLGEYNPAHRFAEAIKTQSINIIDATCPAIHAGLQASQKGIPFMPLRGIIGSDLLKHHPNWKILDNPFSKDKDPIVAVAAIRPDIALFHAPYADRDGNVWVGRRRELITMAQASRTSMITVEKVIDSCLLDDETLAAGTLPNLYVGDISICPNGCWPLGFWQGSAEDSAHLEDYKLKSKTDEGFQQYLDDYVFSGLAS